MSQSSEVFVLTGQTLSPAGSFIPGYGTHIYDGQICASVSGKVHKTSSGSGNGEGQNAGGLSQRSTSSKGQAQKPIISVVSQGKNALPSSNVLSRAQTQSRPQRPDVTTRVLARITRTTPKHAQVDILCLGSPSSSSTSQLHSQVTSTFTPTSQPANSSSSSSNDFYPLSAPYPTGLIRAQDIRATPLDTLSTPGISGAGLSSGSGTNNASTSTRGVILSAFRVGDIVRAVVISMGDQYHYYLSTAADDLGVVLAVSGGGQMAGTGAEKIKGMGGSEDGSGFTTSKGTGNLMYPVSWREMRDPITGASEARKVAKPF